MKVFIIEDEIIAAQNLASMIKEIDSNIDIVGSAGSIEDAVEWLTKRSADLIFMDIHLSDGLSLSIFDIIEVSTPVIFTTAFDKYAVKAFKFNSVDYLLKPIRRTELADALSKFKKLRPITHMDLNKIISEIRPKGGEYKERFLIQIGDLIKKVEEEQIAYFYASDKVVYLRTKEGNTFPIDYSLDKLEEILDPAKYYRINRKFIVKMSSISNMVAYSRGRVKLDLSPKIEESMEAIVSIDRSAMFKKWMDG